MRSDTPLKDEVSQLYPLHRILSSEGTDAALDLVGRQLGEGIDWHVETFPSGEPAWTWTIPPRFEVEEAYLEVANGQRILDFADNPLHLVSYSEPIDVIVEWDELARHLHTNPSRPHAIPWEFKYYERSWGFCLPHDQYLSLDRNARFHAVIRSRFVDQPGLRVGTAQTVRDTVRDGPEMLICAHICHPNQANDGATGVVTAIEVLRRIARTPLPDESLRIRLLIVPETIGSLAYLSRHPEVVAAGRGGIVAEMTGNRNHLHLQRSRQDTHQLDRIARYVLGRHDPQFREGGFRNVISNDEMVINGPGLNIPCISVSRWPYDEYHTSDDNMSIIDEAMLHESADAIEEITRIFASDYVPERTFTGPVFLSGYDLWVDWREDSALNRAIEEIMLSFEGERSVFDIACAVGLDYWSVREYVERFRARGLVKALR